MKFGKIDRFILIGGARLLAEFARYLKKNNYDLVVFSSPRHLDEKIYSDGKTLSDIFRENKIKYFVSENINQDKNLFKYVTPETLGVAMGPAWIFRKPVLELFGKRLLNFMGVPLPRYRGGAHYTWSILRNDKKWACNLQIINKIPDSGAIIKSKEYSFPKSTRMPCDYFDVALNQELKFLEEFLKELRKNKNFSECRLGEAESMYLPYLNTKKQAYVNWAWTTKDIEMFICAFDDPYSGASTFIDKMHVYLKKCHVEFKDGKFHPFTSGIIYRKAKGSIYVAAKGGTLVIKEILNEKENNIIDTLKIGQRFVTPQRFLDEAMEFHAVYTAKGLKAK